MVVNKKTQVAPPMASRTNSSQPLPRKKAPASPPTPPPPVEPNSKKKERKARAKSKKGSLLSWTDGVLLVLLMVFVGYALRVCPSDYGLQDPVCWGLARYRANVVDVYLVGPVKRVAGHPSVRPVVTRVEPVVEKGGEAVRRAVREAGGFVEPRYEAYVKPYVDRGVSYLQRAYAGMSPYLQRAYVFGRPRVVGAYGVCARKLGELRKRFVDPHVGVLWTKVVELSRGGPLPSETPTFESTTPEPTPTLPSAEPTPIEEPVSMTTTEQPTSSSEPVPSPDPIEDPVTASSSETVSPAPSKEPVVLEEPTPDPPVPTPDESDDFLADLDIDFDAVTTSVPSTTTTTSSVTPPTETSRDHAAVASKRANITARHASWASQLDALAASRAATVRKNLSRIRSRAAAVLFGQATEDDDTDFVDGVHVSKLLDVFLDQAEKLVGGLERWWKKESKDADNQERAGKVVARVEEKLDALVREMGQRVENWAARVREDEVRECVVASREVKALAEKAQANLGLDYAWLEDVTYEDWQRYHDLMRGPSLFSIIHPRAHQKKTKNSVYNDFDTQIRQIQNNTHVRPLGDTVLIALEAKQHDMQDAITRFVSRVARVRDDMKPDLDALLMGKSKEQVEQAFEQAQPKLKVGAKKHSMPVAPQIPKPKDQVKILPVGEPLVGEMTEEEVREATREL
ncbi:uncharacterized protein BT62DRAFT_1077792 [Guyanagaster necrorhizus]|uniref:Uncharacterized protein n=1 Tax=Guyanagaster necrorhizus TaxID=856835 RepID=A0A9P7VPS7_9AGAR|nr:uncharacterized protein BT62DRAFT_1077792 [Guyanagaster necrorhizus MCA 3950]KAG7444460.1 hypothetical protein BT62DRAFT_1077792 [Guyanagaster necrorhizus MCA 3950]